MTKSYIHPNLTQSYAKHVFISILLITLAIFAYYAGIMLNALATLLCSKLCWHNRLKPNSVFNKYPSKGIRPIVTHNEVTESQLKGKL